MYRAFLTGACHGFWDREPPFVSPVSATAALFVAGPVERVEPMTGSACQPQRVLIFVNAAGDAGAGNVALWLDGGKVVRTAFGCGGVTGYATNVVGEPLIPPVEIVD